MIPHKMDKWLNILLLIYFIFKTIIIFKNNFFEFDILIGMLVPLNLFTKKISKSSLL